MLAQTATTVQSGGETFLPRLEVPTQAEYIQYLDTVGFLTGAVLLACGLVYLLQGWKTVKVLIVINAAAIGAFAGVYIGEHLQGDNAPLYCGIAGAVLLGAMALPTFKYALSVMGGLGGSVLGYMIWRYAADAVGRPGMLEHAWAGALIGLILLGLLAFALFQLAVVVFTSVQGSVMVVTGLLGLLMKHAALRDALRDSLKANVHLIPLLILVPAAIGFIVQEAAATKKARKRRKSSSSNT
ncbi:MAG: hypothetical protein ACLFV7_12830 [Phycisphaerae bacterium]